MPYKIEYLEEVFEQLARIPGNMRKTLIRAINERLTEAPHRFRPLRCQWKGCYRMRVGTYRIIYRVQDSGGPVLIIKVDARGTVYD